MWSRSTNELVSTHGFSLNQVVVWRYPGMDKLATLTGHTQRCVCSGQGEECRVAVHSGTRPRRLARRLVQPPHSSSRPHAAPATAAPPSTRHSAAGPGFAAAASVLYLSMSPDGQTIVTGAGDETLRFWNVFPSLASQGGGGGAASALPPLGGFEHR